MIFWEGDAPEGHPGQLYAFVFHRRLSPQFQFSLSGVTLVYCISMCGTSMYSNVLGQDWWSNQLKVVKCVTISANNFGVHAWMITLTTLHKLPLDSKKICLAKGWRVQRQHWGFISSFFVFYSLPDPSRPSEPSASPSTPELSFHLMGSTRDPLAYCTLL